MNLIEAIEKVMKKKGITWRQWEEDFEGKETRSLKRKVSSNIEKLQGILEVVGLSLEVTELKEVET